MIDIKYDGCSASDKPRQKPLEAYRPAYEAGPVPATVGLICALIRAARDELRLENNKAVVWLNKVLVQLIRVAISRSLLTEAALAEHLIVSTELRSPNDLLDEVPASWRDEDLWISRRRFLTKRDYTSCNVLVDARTAA